MTDTPRTDAVLLYPDGHPELEPRVFSSFARQLERENAELLEALELLSTHGHADDCLLLNRANGACDCGLDYAHLIIAKAKGETK